MANLVTFGAQMLMVKRTNKADHPLVHPLERKSSIGPLNVRGLFLILEAVSSLVTCRVYVILGSVKQAEPYFGSVSPRFTQAISVDAHEGVWVSTLEYFSPMTEKEIENRIGHNVI